MVRFLPIFILTVSFLSLFLIGNGFLFLDEHVHYKSIEEIYTFKITRETFTRLDPLPGYHFFLSLLIWITGLKSFLGIRLLQTLISLICVALFYFLARRIDPKNAPLKSLQFFLLPLSFLFFFLIYTDILSLLLVLLSFWLTLNKRFILSGFVGLLSLLVRQNNIVWLGFICAYTFYENCQLNFNKENILKFLKNIWVFLLAAVFLLIFIVVNKGTAIHDKNLNPLALRTGNIFFFLFLFFFLNLPQNILNFRNIFKILTKKVWLLFLIFFTFILYLYTFKKGSFFPFNDSDHIIFVNTLILRNLTVNYAVENFTNQVIFFLPVIYSLLSLIVTPLKERLYYLLYPFSLLFLSLSWLIEPRYSIPTMVFFILFKKPQKKWVEYTTLVIYLIFTSGLYFGVLNRKFFP